MATTTFDPTSDAPSAEQQEAEAAALAQGEKIAQAQEEDKQRAFEQNQSEEENVELIGGKFKNQEELLKAYQELEKSRSKENSEEEETPNETTEETEEKTEEPPNETVEYMGRLSQEFEEKGELSEEAIDSLSKMDSKDLIKNYLEYYGKAQTKQQQQTVQASELQSIKESVGGDEKYSAMTSWAADNLTATEINDFNTVTNSGSVAAIKFAVEALNTRYVSAEGYEAPMVSGSKPSTTAKAYRSNAELSRDIANPLYNTDPAFRQDVERRLAQSTDLL